MIKKNIQDQRFRILLKNREGALVKFVGGESSYTFFFSWEVFNQYFEIIEEGDKNACILSKNLASRIKEVTSELDAVANCYVQTILYGADTKDSIQCLMKPITKHLDCSLELLEGIIRRWTSNALVRHQKRQKAMQATTKLRDLPELQKLHDAFEKI